MFEFKHPKYYKELRKRNKSDQAISLRAHDGECERAPDPGLKSEASSIKHQASSPKLFKHRATSVKPQAASVKRQAASNKLQDPGPFKKFQAPLIKGLYQDK